MRSLVLSRAREPRVPLLLALLLSLFAQAGLLAVQAGSVGATAAAPVMGSYWTTPAGLNAGDRVTWQVTIRADSTTAITGGKLEVVRDSAIVPGSIRITNMSQGTSSATLSGATWLYGDVALNRDSRSGPTATVTATLTNSAAGQHTLSAWNSATNAPRPSGTCTANELSACRLVYYSVARTAVQVSVTGDTPRPGEIGRWKVLITSGGGGNAVGVVAHAILPSQLVAPVVWNAPDGTHQGLDWNVGTIAGGHDVVGYVSARMAPTATGRARIGVSVNAANDPRTTSTCVDDDGIFFDADQCDIAGPPGSADLDVTLAGLGPVHRGGRFIYRATVRNTSNGSSLATNIRLSSLFPAGVTPDRSMTFLAVPNLRERQQTSVFITGWVSRDATTPSLSLTTRVTSPDNPTPPSTSQCSTGCSAASVAVSRSQAKIVSSVQRIRKQGLTYLRYTILVANTGRVPLSRVAVVQGFPRGTHMLDVTAVSGGVLNRASRTVSLGSVNPGTIRKIVIDQRLRGAVLSGTPMHTAQVDAWESPYAGGKHANANLPGDTDQWDSDVIR